MMIYVSICRLFRKYRGENSMLREDKLRMMTDLAMFEKKHGAEIRETSDFFRSDYVNFI